MLLIVLGAIAGRIIAGGMRSGAVGQKLDPDLMFEDVFKEMPQNLKRQRDLMRAERRQNSRSGS